MLKVKTQCTYGRGGEEINDTTRHDYVSLELNTLRVGKKMEIRVVYKHTPFPPPSSLRLVTLSSLSRSLLLHLPFFLFPFSLSLPFSSCIFFFFFSHFFYRRSGGGIEGREGGGGERERERERERRKWEGE